MKDVWTGFLQGIGALAAAAVVGWLLSHTPSIAHWLALHTGSLVGPGRIDLTIFLAVLCIALLGLWIACEVRLHRLRQRVRQDKLTIGDMASKKDLMKALDDMDKRLGGRKS
jgi:hypothetical protein